MAENELFESFEEERLDDEIDQDIFECKTCSINFSNVNEHLAKYHSDHDTTAYEMLESEDESKDHEDIGLALVVKTTDGRYKCNQCPKIFKGMKRFITHVKSHKSYSEENLKALEEHLSTKHKKNDDMCEEIKSNSGPILFRCKICNSEFDTRKQLLLHVPMHRNSAEAHNRSRLMPTQGSLICHLCNKAFEDDVELNMHMNAHKENNTMVKKTTAKDTSKKISGGIHACAYCGKEFKRPHEKVRHERVHTKEKPFACDICGKKFRVTYCLSLHKKNVHSEERPYICTFPGCNKRFKSQGVYNHHLNTHGTEKKYKCTFCPKSFKTSVQLAGHKNIHTRPFSCNVCNRTFASLYACKNHMATHNRTESNPLQYNCGICGASYLRAFALNEHMKATHPDLIFEEVEPMGIVEEYVIEEEGPESVGKDETEVYSVIMEN